MSEPAPLAKTAREQLAAALNALQSNAHVPDELMALAEPIAEAMGILHRIERSGGRDLEGRAEALGHARHCLDALQAITVHHPAIDTVMDSVAAALSKIHALTRIPAPAPAPVAPAPAPAPPAPAVAAPRPPASMPSGGPGFASTDPAPRTSAPFAPNNTAVMPHAAAPQPAAAPARPASQPAFPAAQPQPSFAAPVQPAPQAAFPPPAPAQPSFTAPVPGPAYAGGGAAPFPQPPAPFPQPQAAPFPQPQAAPFPPQAYQPPPQAAPQPAYQPPPQAAPQAYQPPQPAYQPPPQAARPAQAPAPAASRPAGTIDVELGAHSPSNFYKGLGGNDVIEHGGIFVATYKIPKIGSTVSLRVLLPGDFEFQANAVVQWTREASGGGDSAEPGFGARFTQISPEGRNLVYRYTRNREPIFYDDL